MMNISSRLKGKNVLFFSVQTFNLEREIIRKMEELGALVTYFDERPANNTFTKGLIRIKKNILQKKIDNYYASVLKQIQNEKFDFLFVNRGEVVTIAFLQEFIKKQPQCERIFYTWDSFTNNSHATKILSFFHKRFTFDRKDAESYVIGFRPLYFIDIYRKLRENKADAIEYDLLFLGTAHSDRYVISNKIVDWCSKNKLSSHCYYYMQGKWVYLYKRLLDKTFKKFDYKKLSFQSLSTDGIIALYKKSNVILDINHPGQSGLTMRTFESIGAGKKMITTNKDVVKYPFYNPQNIYIIDRENIQLEKLFFETDYIPVSDEMYERCSIRGWLEDLFCKEESLEW